LGGKLGLRQAKQGRKLCDRQAGNPEIHLCALLVADAYRLAAPTVRRAPILAIEYRRGQPLAKVYGTGGTGKPA
jgi:hypothetical protein